MATKKKLRVGILFGGRSGEHEVSLRSARSILSAIDRKKYDVVELGITKEGRWLQGGQAQRLLGTPVTVKGAGAGSSLVSAASKPGVETGLDVVFPVLHGTFGEDGTIQGLFELAGTAYVGSGVLGSSVGMDKDAMKRMFVAAGLPVTPWVTLLRSEWKASPKKCIKLIEESLEYPLFVKPANLGSSVGISKVKSRADLTAAMDEAASFDRKIVIEQGVGGAGVKPRELEVAVLGNDAPEASVVGEIVPAKEFYDYEAKYELSGPDESVSHIPAKLSKAEAKRIRQMSIDAFRACDLAGLARVDFLMAPRQDGEGNEIVLNEVNTLPGFTSISMYPKLWEASGLPYRQLIDRLIELALERAEERRQTRFEK
ncbi:D-alanine--D-alanine ligase family protein [Granulicella cerasi]|uniref:D-alanine--D-alanine ligase n=1 Tax=Granulicella cerasi TaxID=741063 RepID=A0ABW1ZD12_9BACT|nr:D-alanine--D-alanine ligase family protein [Granulicella cerasi]